MFDVIIIPGSGSLIFKSSSNDSEITSSIKLNEQGLLEFLNNIIFKNDVILSKVDVSTNNTDNLLVIGSGDKIKYVIRNQFTASYAVSASYAHFIPTASYYDNLITNEIILYPTQNYIDTDPPQQIFTTSNYFIEDSLEIFFNGLKLINGYDYNIINANLKQFQITSSIVIKTGDSIVVNYKKRI